MFTIVDSHGMSSPGPYLSQTLKNYLVLDESLNVDNELEKMIPNQVRLLGEDTFLADDNWITLWEKEWKSRWENLKP